MDLDRMRTRPCRKCGALQTEKGTCGDMWHVPNRNGAEAQRIRRWENPYEREMFLDEVRRFVTEDSGDFLANIAGYEVPDNVEQHDDGQQQQQFDLQNDMNDPFHDGLE